MDDSDLRIERLRRILAEARLAEAAATEYARAFFTGAVVFAVTVAFVFAVGAC